LSARRRLGGRGRKRREVKEREKLELRRSHRSNSVRGVGCKEQEKTWTVVMGYTPQ